MEASIETPLTQPDISGFYFDIGYCNRRDHLLLGINCNRMHTGLGLWVKLELWVDEAEFPVILEAMANLPCNEEIENLSPTCLWIISGQRLGLDLSRQLQDPAVRAAVLEQILIRFRLLRDTDHYQTNMAYWRRDRTGA